MYVLIVSGDGYDLPEAIGPFDAEAEADQAAADLGVVLGDAVSTAEVQRVSAWLSTDQDVSREDARC